MGNPIRHLSRATPAGVAVHAIASRILNSHDSAHATLWHLCEEALHRLGVRKELADAPPDYPSDLLKLYEQAVALSPPCTEILGDVYMLLGSQGHRQTLGQFFTPTPLCDFLAQLQMIPDLSAPGPMVKVLEPSSGAGGMLLGVMRTILATSGPAGFRRLSLTGVDLDPLCARMTAVQILVAAQAHSLPIGHVAICQGNGLSPMHTWQPIVIGTDPSLRPEDMQSLFGVTPPRLPEGPVANDEGPALDAVA
jgi:hypothetical protein